MSREDRMGQVSESGGSGTHRTAALRIGAHSSHPHERSQLGSAKSQNGQGTGMAHLLCPRYRYILQTTRGGGGCCVTLPIAGGCAVFNPQKPFTGRFHLICRHHSLKQQGVNDSWNGASQPQGSMNVLTSVSSDRLAAQLDAHSQKHTHARVQHLPHNVNPLRHSLFYLNKSAITDASREAF
ncbi:uncharacterized protein ACBT44_004095 isoform 1-T1 [Syngnathus typhle]